MAAKKKNRKSTGRKSGRPKDSERKPGASRQVTTRVDQDLFDFMQRDARRCGLSMQDYALQIFKRRREVAPPIPELFLTIDEEVENDVVSESTTAKSSATAAVDHSGLVQRQAI